MPHTGLLPVSQASPAGHAAASDLSGQHTPRYAASQDVHDPFKGNPVGYAGPASPPLAWFRRQQRLDDFPQPIVYQASHPSANLSKRTPPRTTTIPVSRSRFAGSPRNKIPRST